MPPKRPPSDNPRKNLEIRRPLYDFTNPMHKLTRPQAMSKPGRYIPPPTLLTSKLDGTFCVSEQKL